MTLLSDLTPLPTLVGTERVLVIRDGKLYRGTIALVRGEKGDKGDTGIDGSIAQPVITRKQALKALRNVTSNGINYLTAVQNAISADENSDDNIDFMSWEWPANGSMWLRVQTILNTALNAYGGFNTTQRQALENSARLITD